MKKIFIDCGFHHGEGLRHFIKTLKIDEAWHVITFEPNPACKMLDRSLEIMQEFPALKTIDGFGNAVYVHNGESNFIQENHFKTDSGSPVDGVSMIDGWASKLECIDDNTKGFEPPIKVKCIDFSMFLINLPYHLRKQYLAVGDDFQLFVKMDIEGAEFAVLRKMLKDGTVKMVNKLWVEFHERFVPGESFQTKKQLIEELSQHTEVIEWR